LIVGRWAGEGGVDEEADPSKRICIKAVKMIVFSVPRTVWPSSGDLCFMIPVSDIASIAGFLMLIVILPEANHCDYLRSNYRSNLSV